MARGEIVKQNRIPEQESGFVFSQILPDESVAAYKAAEGWRDYADAIVGYDF